LTHGHEDHIGALPWILSELNVPVWERSSRSPMSKTSWMNMVLLDSADCARFVQAKLQGRISYYSSIQVTHSLVDCVSLAIHTPLAWSFTLAISS